MTVFSNILHILGQQLNKCLKVLLVAVGRVAVLCSVYMFGCIYYLITVMGGIGGCYVLTMMVGWLFCAHYDGCVVVLCSL